VNDKTVVTFPNPDLYFLSLKACFVASFMPTPVVVITLRSIS